MEIWKDIKYYKGLYQVSNKGRVKSLGNGLSNRSIKGILKYGVVRCYKRYYLSKNGKTKAISIHRLVAQSFLGLDINNKKMFALHKKEHLTNGLLNNDVNNLWIGTAKDNAQDMSKKGRSGNPKNMLGKTLGKSPISKKVNQYTLEGELIKHWDCIKIASDTLGIHGGNIGNVCNGKRKKCGGFIWKFKN